MDKLIKIYDNILPEYLVDGIENYTFNLKSDISPLEFNVVHKLSHPDIKLDFEDIGFGNTVLNSTNNTIKPKFSLILQPLYYLSNIKKFLITQIFATRVWIQIPMGFTSPQAPHVDIDHDHYVFLYYINDCDGDTIFFDKNQKEYKRVSPKKGRCILFDGSIYHTGSKPKNKSRGVININFKAKFFKPL